MTEATPMTDRDYYETLQVIQTAESEVIEAAYKRLAFKYHPDRNVGSDGDKMRELNEAYETLRDPQRRQRYDDQRNADETLQQLVQYVHSMLDQGTTLHTVIDDLVQKGIDPESAAAIVNTVVEARRSVASPVDVSKSLLLMSGWLRANWGWVGLAGILVIVFYIYFNPLKSDLPVVVSFRRSIGGGSLVAIYQNNSNEALSLSVTLRSKTASQEREVILEVGPNQAIEHGWLEGWSYKTGESVSIANRHYKPLQISVP